MKNTALLSTLLAASQLPSYGVIFFESDLSSGAGWQTNASGADTSAIFGYDYSAAGVPEAPNSVGGPATTGLRMAANIVAPTAGESLIVYPTGQNFTGTYTLRFDAWMNYDLNAYHNQGAAGTTEFLGGGIGYDGISNDIGSGAQILNTNDGGSGSDWRSFATGQFQSTDAMAAGTRNGFDPYYADFLPGGIQPPALQGQVLTPGSTAGSPGFQWYTWEITVYNNNVHHYIEKPGGDRLEIISYDKTDPDSTTNTDGNIGLIYADFFSSVATDPDLAFGLIDNVVVTHALVPEPGSSTLLALGLGTLIMARKRRS